MLVPPVLPHSVIVIEVGLVVKIEWKIAQCMI